MSAAPAIKRLTLRDYLEMPDTNQRQEIVDGELRLMPSPDAVHQRIVRRLVRSLEGPVEGAGFGEVFQSPLDVLIREEPFTYRQPDAFVIRREELVRYPGFERVVPLRPRPCLVVEVLSGSNYPRQMAERLADYAAIGVEEVWLVSMEAQTVEVLQPAPGGFERASVHAGDQEIGSSVLPGLRLAAASLFA
jgi:Uma2 family endonuclease